MIDYFLQFNTEADAITAATGTVLGQNVQVTSSSSQITSGSSQTVWSWNTDFVLPGAQAWRISQDVTSSDGHVTHTFLPNWYCIVSLKNLNAQLNNHPNLAFTLDRDGPPYVIKNNVGAVITNLGYQPVFTGSYYPIGGLPSS